EVTFNVPYNPSEEEGSEDKEEQTVEIFIDDMNHDMSEVFHKEKIKKETDFTITLTIKEDEDAEYKVMRDGEVDSNKTVSYEEGESVTEGQIIKALSGFYYVRAEDTVYRCRGRGVFRKKGIHPLVGDYVNFDINDPNEGYITEVKPRKNELMRPPVANIDQAIIVSSSVKPEFNPLLLDRFLVLIEYKSIKPIIFITKADAASTE